MEKISAELLAISRAGHDRGTLYVVLAEEGSCCWLADGRLRPLAKPKKKKKMHIQVIKHLPPELLCQMAAISTDADIRRILKAWREKDGVLLL